MGQRADDVGRSNFQLASLLAAVRDIALAANEIASPRLIAVLGQLESFSENDLLPLDLRSRAHTAALRVAEAAVQLESLLEALDAADDAVAIPEGGEV
jgi:hypothetical protein